MTKICVIEPSSAGLELLPAAKSLNLETIVFNANRDERIIPEKYHRYIDQFVEMDTYNVSLIYDWLNKTKQLSSISGIIPGSEYHVPIAAQLSGMMNLPGIFPEYADRLRIKSKMRECLEEKNVRNPRYRIISTEDQLLIASRYVGFPCVIKPIASAGSVHVSRANTFDELTFAYQEMCKDQWTELGKGIGKIAIVEEYINGDEFSVEGYIENSKAKIISITEKLLFPEPHFVEMGHILPANISQKKQQAIDAYVQDVIKALDINLGAFHCELRIDHQGPVLMEIAGRLPGDRICDLIKLAKKIDLCQIMIQSHMGKLIHINPKQQQYAGIRYFALNNLNSFNSIDGKEKLQLLPGFYEFKSLRNPGESVPILKDFSARVAAAIFVAPTYDELKHRLNMATSLISFL